MEKKLKGGAEKLRFKKLVNLQAIANDPKQKNTEILNIVKKSLLLMNQMFSV